MYFLFLPMLLVWFSFKCHRFVQRILMESSSTDYIQLMDLRLRYVFIIWYFMCFFQSLAPMPLDYQVLADYAFILLISCNLQNILNIWYLSYWYTSTVKWSLGENHAATEFDI